MIPISVIIPVYKVEKYLRRCLDSVLKQTFSNFELILVDDGSPDNSGMICDDYARKDSRIQVIHKVNEGVSIARNIGISIANGKFITFIDSDDEVEREYLEKLLNVDENIDLVVCGLQKRNEHGKKIGNLEFSQRKICKITSEDILEMSTEKSLNYVYAKRFKRELIKQEQILFDDKLNLGEDTLFVVDYLYACQNVRFIKEKLYIYYDYNGGTLSGFNEKYVEKLVNANFLIEKSLERRWEVKDNLIWKQRLWSVYHYSIFYILKSEQFSLKEKRKVLYNIFNMESINIFCKI